MYRTHKAKQLDLFTQIAPIMDVLDREDEIIKLADSIDWDYIEKIYSRNFTSTKKSGNPNNYPARVAFGALFLKQYSGLTDRQLVQQIKQNPYWQYFLGYEEYSPMNTFHPSTMVDFRKRFPEDFLNELNARNAQKVIDKWNNSAKKDGKKVDQDDHENNQDNDQSASSPEDSDQAAPSDEPVQNHGTVKIDAICCVADVAFPTDLNLLNKSRIWTEKCIDHLYATYGSLNKNGTKPRTYRQEARNKYHAFVKHPRVRKTKTMRNAVKEQLGYVKRNLKIIDHYISEFPDCLDSLFPVERNRLETVRIVYDQQQGMYKSKSHTVENRIISLSQPYIRPIVRGKQKAKVEFGAKLSISVVEGYTFIDKLSFDSYNEGTHEEFLTVMENYRNRFGCYPEKVLADKIYGNRQNRKWCKEHGIHLSAEPLGRKRKDQREQRQQKRQDTSERNEVECKFGNLKRRWGMDLITSKLEATGKTEITMSIVTMNLIRNTRLSQA